MQKTNASWVVAKAKFSAATGLLSISGENRANPREPSFSWHIGVWSLENEAWRRYDWSETTWLDERSRETFKRWSGVSVDAARSVG